MPDGTTHFHKGEPPVEDRLRGSKSEIPTIEVFVEFEAAVPPRPPKLIDTKPVEPVHPDSACGDSQENIPN